MLAIQCVCVLHAHSPYKMYYWSIQHHVWSYMDTCSPSTVPQVQTRLPRKGTRECSISTAFINNTWMNRQTDRQLGVPSACTAICMGDSADHLPAFAPLTVTFSALRFSLCYVPHKHASPLTGGSQSMHVPRNVLGKDDGSHARLTRPVLPQSEAPGKQARGQLVRVVRKLYRYTIGPDGPVRSGPVRRGPKIIPDHELLLIDITSISLRRYLSASVRNVENSERANNRIGLR